MAPSIDLLTAPTLDDNHSTASQCFWNANLPSSQWTEKCPDFLLGLGTKNIGILSGRQEDYRNLGWEEAKELVGES